MTATVADILIMANSQAKRKPRLIDRPGGRRKIGGDRKYTPQQIDRLFARAAAVRSDDLGRSETVQ